MGIIYGEWTFEKETSLNVEAIAQALKDRMKLDVLFQHEYGKPIIFIPLLKEKLIHWECDKTRISTSTVMPENPYVWGHLNTLMLHNGASISTSEPIAWRPAKDLKIFQQPWTNLTWLEKCIVKNGMLGPFRPFDKYLS